MARIDFVTGNAQQYLPEVEALAAIPDRIEALLAVHSSVDLIRPTAVGDDGEPAVNEWSPERIIGHMISEARHGQERIYSMVWMTDPVFVEYDDEQEALDNAWEDSDVTSLLEELAKALADTVQVLKELPDAGWGRASIHPSRGRRSIRQLVRIQLSHYDEHIAQLARALEC